MKAKIIILRRRRLSSTLGMYEMPSILLPEHFWLISHVKPALMLKITFPRMKKKFLKLFISICFELSSLHILTPGKRLFILLVLHFLGDSLPGRAPGGSKRRCLLGRVGGADEQRLAEESAKEKQD